MFQEQLEQTAASSGQMGTGQTDSGFSQGFFSILSLMEFSSLPLSPLACLVGHTSFQRYHRLDCTDTI